jgi:glutamate-1-semialdehyde 2,1-aminomutase
MENRYKKSIELNEKLHSLIPGGGHTYSKGEDQFPYFSPRVMSRAQGAYCWDVDGNQYVDWGMGNRVIILGHNHPVVNDAVKAQLNIGLNFTRPSMLEYELAEYLVDLFPAAEMVKFGKNGSDVTTAAIKLSRAYTGRKYIACCSDHPFFSVHDWFIGSTPMNSGVPNEISNFTLKFSYNDIEGLKKLFDAYYGQIAGVILEPVKNDVPQDDFLTRLRDLTRREGTVLIFDEMISGLRFDVRGAHHLWGVYPDLVTFGKAIANGFSFSVLAGNREIMDLGGIRHSNRRVFLLSQTHGAEGTGLAACRATLEEYQRGEVNTHIGEIGKKLVNGIRALAEEERVADFVRVIGFEVNPQIVCTSAEGKFWPALQTSFHEEVLSRGVIIPWTSITFSHGERELDLTFEALRHGMRKIRRALDTETVEGSFYGPSVKPVFRPYNRCMQSECGRLNAEVPKLDCCRD